jgi:repressor LexA
MLTMTDDSMIDAAIADGDWVVVRQQSEPASGEIVAVLIGEEATVRTFRQVDGNAWLIPNNPGRTPIPADTATILGKVVAILRRLDPPDA